MGEVESLPLRDIHLPDPVSWWPPAPGWWVLLGGLILLLLALLAFRVVHRRRRVRVAALKALQAISLDFSTDRDAHRLVKSLSILLRRTCLSYFPRAEVAGLTGEKWLRFLDDCLDWGNLTDRFSEGDGRVLISAPYQPQAAIDGDKLLFLCGHWIRALPLLKEGKQ
ncbi:MAG: DUF4381 domain-containing protein [Nitrospiria bacterium]